MQVCKTYEIDKYLKYYTCVNSVIDDVVITCDTFVGTPETVSINHNDKKKSMQMGYHNLHTILFVTMLVINAQNIG